MPPSNFSQTGLARLFGFDFHEDTGICSNKAHKRTAIISGTVCGIVGLAIVVALGGYAAWRWRKAQIPPEEPVHEKDVRSDVHGRVVEPVELPPTSTSEQLRQDEST